MKSLSLWSIGLLGLCWFNVSLLADEDHHHGEASAAPAGPAWPRFAAASEHFELVGVLESGHELRLFLDHAADNRPVTDATLVLKANDQVLPVVGQGAGLFEVDWDDAPASGEVIFTAEIQAAGLSDRLVADLDLPEPDGVDHPAFALDWPHDGPWLLVGGAGLILGGLGLAYGCFVARRGQPEVRT